MSKKTPLYDLHVDAKALIVDFSGWQMPLHYGSQIEEHHAVRKNAGLFDVSHMGVIEISGKDTVSFLRTVLANDINKLKNTGDALYSCLLNHQGGIIDDLIAYKFSDDYFRLVVNAGCRDKDFNWLKTQSEKFNIKLNWRSDCLLALQGPNAIDYLKNIFDEKIINQIKTWNPKIKLIAFKAVWGGLEKTLTEKAQKKLQESKADAVVVNDVSKKDRGFQADTNEVIIVKKNGEKKKITLRSKREVAEKIINFTL